MQSRRDTDPIPRVDGHGHRDDLAEFTLGEGRRGTGLDGVGDVAATPSLVGAALPLQAKAELGDACRRAATVSDLCFPAGVDRTRCVKCAKLVTLAHLAGEHGLKTARGFDAAEKLGL